MGSLVIPQRALHSARYPADATVDTALIPATVRSGMLRSYKRWLLLSACVGAIAAGGAVRASGGVGAAATLLPDLDPVAPGSIQPIAATDGSGRTFLTFTFVVDNTGKGPLHIRAHRASVKQLAMIADQVIDTSGGGSVVVKNVGRVGWLPDRGFLHWGFKQHSYRLIPARGGKTRVAAPLPLCIEDNRRTPRSQLAGEPKDKVFEGRCGKRQDQLLKLDLGISVGWRNLHLAGKEGQLIDITKAPSGEYTLVTVANAANRLRESSVSNNSASARISITWKQGRRLPVVTVIKSCDDGATCG